MIKKICTIYRSPKQEGMYLYVDKVEDLARVPEALLSCFGKPERALTFLLHPDRKLARVDAKKVLAELEEKGYFLQIQHQYDAYMREIHEKNAKM
ncbi:MAG: YcgL domain-containing protein [Pseudomonadales bacterium]